MPKCSRVNPRITTIFNTALLTGLLYKVLPHVPRTKMAPVRLNAVDKQVAVGLGSAAAAYLLIGFVSRLVLWLQKSNRLPTSSKIG